MLIILGVCSNPGRSFSPWIKLAVRTLEQNKVVKIYSEMVNNRFPELFKYWNFDRMFSQTLLGTEKREEWK